MLNLYHERMSKVKSASKNDNLLKKHDKISRKMKVDIVT